MKLREECEKVGIDPAVFRTPTAEWFAAKSDGTFLYDQVGQGGIPLTLRGLQGPGLGVPWFWVATVAAPGGTQTTSADPTTLGVALAPTTTATTATPVDPLTAPPAVRVTPRHLTWRRNGHRRTGFAPLSVGVA